VKILTVTSLFPRRGAPSLGVFILQRVKALAAEGAEVRVLAPVPWVPPGPVPARYAAMRAVPRVDVIEGIEVGYPRYPMIPKVGMRLQAWGYATGLRRSLRREMAQFKPDVLDVHYLYPDACGVARLAHELDIPYVCTARGSDVHVLGRMPALLPSIRRALEGAAAVIAVSRDLATRMGELGLYRGSIEVIPNGVDRTRFFPRPCAEARCVLGLAPNDPMVLCIGHLVPVHGQELLLRALARPEAPRDLTLHFLGDGPDRGALQDVARGLGIADRVFLHGAVDHRQIPVWLAASNMSAQLSRSAGSPNAVLESVACGIPVLATDIPAMREALPVPGQGRFVQPEPDAVAEALGAIARNGLSAPTAAIRGWQDVAADILACLQRNVGRNLS